LQVQRRKRKREQQVLKFQAGIVNQLFQEITHA
jgi:hypothetical protein